MSALLNWPEGNNFLSKINAKKNRVKERHFNMHRGMQRKKDYALNTVQSYISRGHISLKSMALGSYCAPDTVPGTGDLVPVFKELRTRSLFMISIVLH